jgi:hypothetical protein
MVNLTIPKFLIKKECLPTVHPSWLESIFHFPFSVSRPDHARAKSTGRIPFTNLIPNHVRKGGIN